MREARAHLFAPSCPVLVHEPVIQFDAAESSANAGRREFADAQFTPARPARPRLVNLRRTLPARNPQTCVCHQLPDGLLGQPNAVTFPELLAGQRRPKIGVALSNNGQGA